MKHLLIILAFFISLQAISQTDNEKECTENAAKAIVDFNNGELTGYYNHIEIEFKSAGKFEFFYHAYMYSKYSIHMETYPEEYECYTKKMDSLVRSKYGADIYKKTRKKALALYENSTREERSKVLDVSKIYIKTESQPKFIGNDYTVHDFLKKHFLYKGKEAAGQDFEFRIITLQINRKGKIVDIKSKTDILKDGFTKDKIISEMNSLGNFVPAYLIGVPVNSKIDIDLW